MVTKSPKSPDPKVPGSPNKAINLIPASPLIAKISVSELLKPSPEMAQKNKNKDLGNENLVNLKITRKMTEGPTEPDPVKNLISDLIEGESVCEGNVEPNPKKDHTNACSIIEIGKRVRKPRKKFEIEGGETPTEKKKSESSKNTPNDNIEETQEHQVVYCLCKQLNDESKEMIRCDYCEDWFHHECVDLHFEGEGVQGIIGFKCPECRISCQEVSQYEPSQSEIDNLTSRLDKLNILLEQEKSEVERLKEIERKMIREAAEIRTNGATEQSSQKCSPSRKKGKKCSDECTKLKSAQNQTIRNLENDKRALRQKVETVEKQQESLRDTLTNKEKIIASQSLSIESHVKTINNQKMLISNQEIRISTHSDLANSFMDNIFPGEGDGKNDDVSGDKRDSTLITQLHEKVKTLEEQLSSQTIIISEMEKTRNDATAKVPALQKDRDKYKKNLDEVEKKLNGSKKEYAGLRSQLLIMEEAATVKEKEVKALKGDQADVQAQVESLTLECDKLRNIVMTVEKENEELSEKIPFLLKGAVADPAGALSNPEVATNHLLNQLEDKDKQIKDLEVNIAYTEKSVLELKTEVETESARVKLIYKTS